MGWWWFPRSWKSEGHYEQILWLKNPAGIQFTNWHSIPPTGCFFLYNRRVVNQSNHQNDSKTTRFKPNWTIFQQRKFCIFLLWDSRCWIHLWSWTLQNEHILFSYNVQAHQPIFQARGFRSCENCFRWCHCFPLSPWGCRIGTCETFNSPNLKKLSSFRWHVSSTTAESLTTSIRTLTTLYLRKSLNLHPSIIHEHTSKRNHAWKSLRGNRWGIPN